MRNKGSGLRRAAAVLAAAVAMMAVTGPSATAASTKLPAILDASASSQALRLRVELPSLQDLEKILTEVTGTAVDLPDVDLPETVPTVIEQKISLNNAAVQRAQEGVDKATGFAASTIGNLLGSKSVSTTCTSKSCNKVKDVAALSTSLPAGLGSVRVAGARSATKGLYDTRNTTELARVDLSLQELLETAGVSETLATLTDVINNDVLPIVNEQLAAAEATIEDLLESNAPAVKEELDRLITLGTIKELPRLDKVGLLELTVLDSHANIMPKTVAGKAGLLATSASKVADLSVLGDWAKIDAVGLTSKSFANGVAGAAKAASDVSIVGADLGGALGIHVEEEDLARVLKDPSSLIEAIEQDAPEGLEVAFDEIVASLKLLQTIAGISVEFFPDPEAVDPKGMWARSSGGTLQLTVEPKIPTKAALENAVTGVGDTIVPRLDPKKDFVSAGIRVELELPEAATAVAVQGDVKGVIFKTPARTGVATPVLAALVMIGAALLVRRFALSK